MNWAFDFPVTLVGKQLVVQCIVYVICFFLYFLTDGQQEKWIQSLKRCWALVLESFSVGSRQATQGSWITVFIIKLRLFSYPSILPCVLGDQKNWLIETVLFFSTHNICFILGIRKSVSNYILLSCTQHQFSDDETLSCHDQKFSVIVLLFVSQGICFWCLKELSHWDSPFEYPHHMF